LDINKPVQKVLSGCRGSQAAVGLHGFSCRNGKGRTRFGRKNPETVLQLQLFFTCSPQMIIQLSLFKEMRIHSFP
jgi:hypothetical protein